MTISDTKLAGWRTLSDWMRQPQVSFAVLFIMKSRCRQHVHDIKKRKTQIISICVPSSVRLNMTGSGRIRARWGLLHLRDFLGFIRAVQRSTCRPRISSPPSLLCTVAMTGKMDSLGGDTSQSFTPQIGDMSVLPCSGRKISNPHQKKALSHGGVEAVLLA